MGQLLFTITAQCSFKLILDFGLGRGSLYLLTEDENEFKVLFIKASLDGFKVHVLCWLS